MSGSQRSMRSTSFTSAGGEVSPRGSSAARQSSAALSRRTSRSGEDDSAAAIPDSASATSGPASVSAAEERPSFRRGARSVAAASEAGSVDAASLATERGSEAVLGDLEESATSAAGLRLGPMPEGDTAELDEGAEPSAKESGRADVQLTEESSHESGTEQDGSKPNAGHDSRAHPAQPGQEAASADAGISDSGRHAESVKDPLRFSNPDTAADSRAAAPEAAAGFSGKQIRVDRASETGSVDGREPAELCTPTYGDVGHLPVARTTPDRALSSHSDRGHMTATSSQVRGHCMRF